MKKYKLIVTLVIVVGCLVNIPIIHSYEYQSRAVFKISDIGDDYPFDSTMTPPTNLIFNKYTNQDSIFISWTGSPDEKIYEECFYHLTLSSNTLFDPPLFMEPIDSGSTFTELTMDTVARGYDTEGVVYIRMFSLGRNDTGSWRRSDSTLDWFVYDIQSPDLDSFYISDYDSDSASWTDDPKVRLNINASDNYRIAWLEVSEDPLFDGEFDFSDSIPIDVDSDFDSNLVYQMSPQKRVKHLYVRVIDAAGNKSNVISDSIDLYDTGLEAHNYPNPFNPDIEKTNLVFRLDQPEQITITIFDLFGNLVYKRKISGNQGLNDGSLHGDDFRWDGKTSDGQPVASGGYICLIEDSNGFQGQTKIAVAR